MAEAILYYLVLGILVSITVIDIQTHEIPDLLNLALFVSGLFEMWINPVVSISSRVAGIFIVSVPLLTIAMIIKNSFGGGDIKMTAAAGFLLGVKDVIVASFIGILAGGIYGIFVLISKKKTTKEGFAFGPCLSSGIFIAMLGGDKIIDCYLNLL